MKHLYTVLMVMLSLLLFGVPAAGDDTEIYGASSVDVPPNVLVLFVTSGSLENLIYPADTTGTQVPTSYQPGEDYAQKIADLGDSSIKAYVENGIYIRETQGGGNLTDKYLPFPSRRNNGTPLPIEDFTCEAPKQSLLGSSGSYTGSITTDGNSYECGTGPAETLYLGKYLNYGLYMENGPFAELGQTKLSLAIAALKDFVVGMDDNLMRVGLMTLNKTQVGGQGGKLIAPLGSSDADIATALDAIGSTNLVAHSCMAEALAEAGLYFGGKKSWSSNNTNDPPYTIPMEWRCQSNYVIIVTDTLPDGNADSGINNSHEDILRHKNSQTGESLSADLYFGEPITDEYMDTETPDRWIHDVARYLFFHDIVSGTLTKSDGTKENFDDESYEQNVRTHAIGFELMGDPAYLQMVTDSDHGNGEYYSATGGYTALRDALDAAAGKILRTNSSFIAPVVPVSKLNKVYSGNSVYVSLFKPQEGGFWIGNLKKFGLDTESNLLQKDGTDAVVNGEILLDASSCWDFSLNDNINAKMGGAGAVLLHQPSNTLPARQFYTNIGGSVEVYLTADQNAFSSSNSDSISAITEQLQLGTGDPTATDLINYLTARGVYAPGSDYDTAREWVLGDILHSKPATMNIGNKTIVFVGSNDGFLHVFEDDGGTTVDDLSDDVLIERWCFVPWDLLPRLKGIKGGTHEHFVDGSPVIYDVTSDGNGYRYVAFGLRRGGNKYYILRIGSITNGVYDGAYNSPYLAATVGSDVLTSAGGTETLGQSWSRPWVSTIKTGANSAQKVLFLAGGYDADNQDLITPAQDTRGRAVLAVDAATGALVRSLGTFGTVTMSHCAVELVVFDRNGDGFDDTIYAGNLGGNLYAFTDRDGDGLWTPYHVFQTRFGSTENMQLKFLTEPDVSLETFGDYVFIGSGDREHPKDMTTVNRFYAIKNEWPNVPLTESDLVDVTDYSVYQNADTAAALESGHGWVMRFTHTGEKIVSPPLLYNGMVFFTTYTPKDPADTDDPCAILGVGRIYALDYRTGKSVLDFDGDGTKDEENDRSMVVAENLPSAPTLVVTETGKVALLVSTGDRDSSPIHVPDEKTVNTYYWLQR